MIKALLYAAPAGIAAGVGLILQPWWPDGFKTGFLVVACSTLLHIVATHVGTGGDA